MRLNNLTHESLMYLERYVNQKSYSPFSEYSEVSSAYQPKSDQPYVPVVFANVPADEVTVELAGPSDELVDFYLGDTIRFPIHPDLYHDPRHRDVFLREIRASSDFNVMQCEPTASTRTLLVHGAVEQHFVKLHLPRRISRFNRRLRRVGIHNSMVISRDLQQFDIGSSAGFMPETIGLWNKRSSWGALVREYRTLPSPMRPEEVMIPYFSLYSQDIHHLDEPPLLVQLIDYHKADPLSFVVDSIIGPVVRSWARVANERGILLAPHGQNALLTLDSKKRPYRVIHRDFVGLDIDGEIRHARNLPGRFTKYVMPMGDPEYRRIRYSHIYDYQMGHHLFSVLAGLVQTTYGTKLTAIQSGVADILHSEFNDYDSCFPETTYQYANRAFPTNKSEVIATGEKPLWR